MLGSSIEVSVGHGCYHQTAMAQGRGEGGLTLQQAHPVIGASARHALGVPGFYVFGVGAGAVGAQFLENPDAPVVVLCENAGRRRVVLLRGNHVVGCSLRSFDKPWVLQTSNVFQCSVGLHNEHATGNIPDPAQPIPEVKPVSTEVGNHWETSDAAGGQMSIPDCQVPQATPHVQHICFPRCSTSTLPLRDAPEGAQGGGLPFPPSGCS